jgi:parallel beta-helix repeat protein
MDFRFSRNNFIRNNILTNNSVSGILLRYSGNNTLKDNILVNNDFILYEISYYWEEPPQFQDFLQVEVDNNTINGKSLVYWQNRPGGTIPNGAGQVILVNSTDVIVTGQNLSNISTGLFVLYSSNIAIQNNTISDNEKYGILLKYSNHSIISENIVCDNAGQAIRLYNSKNNSLSENFVFNNSKNGIYDQSIPYYWSPKLNRNAISLESSGGCTIIDNTISNNHGNGISISDSKNSSIIKNIVNTNLEDGIKFENSGNSSLTGNIIFNNKETGIILDKSENNVILNNILVNNGLFVEGEELKYFLQSAVENNTVNGKALIYWQHHTASTIPSNAGQVLLVNSTGVIVTGQNLSKTSTGLLAVYSSNIVIHNNTINDNEYYGILLKYSSYSIISENILRNNPGRAIHLYKSGNSNLSKNLVFNNSITGIKVEYWYFDYGFYYERMAIYLESSEGCNIWDNILSNNHADVLSIHDSSYSNLTGNTILNNTGTGIELRHSKNSIIANNSVSNNGGTGINIFYSESSTLSGNSLFNNGRDGIDLYDSESSTLSGNSLFNNGDIGIHLRYSENSFLMANTVSNNQKDGISLYRSGNNVISNNIFLNNGLSLDGGNFEEFYQATVVNNTVNGKPLVYWQDIYGGSISDSAGQIFLIACTAVTVTKQVLSNSSVGLFAFYSSDLVLHDNIMSNNTGSGISIEESRNLTISNNIITNNQKNGIGLSYSKGIVISRNIVSDNKRDGISLDQCERGTLSHNTVSRNHEGGIEIGRTQDWIIRENTIEMNFWNGITLVRSTENHFFGNYIGNNSDFGISLEWDNIGNVIKYNDIINNNLEGDSQASDDSEYSYYTNNVFSRNYWNDWIRPDGNADGTVDEPYLIDGSSENQDFFPLISLAPKHHLTTPYLLMPLGGEILSNMVAIRWVVTNDSWEHQVSYDVYYSPDDGKTWDTLVSSFKSTIFVWNTKEVPDGVSYRVKVVVKCPWGLQTEDIPSGVFTIRHSEVEPVNKPLLSIQNVGITILIVISVILIGLDYKRNSRRISKLK